MLSEIKYVKELPMVNSTFGFIILDSEKNNIENLWVEFMKKILLISIENEEHFKAIGDAMKDGVGFHDLKRSYARDLLGIGKKLSVLEITHENGVTKYTALKSFEELVSIYINEKESTLNRAIIDRFFLFLWNKKIFLYPIVNKVKNYHRPTNWKTLASTSEILDFLNEIYNKKETSMIKSYQVTAVLSMLSATKWKGIDDITELDLVLLEATLKSLEKKLDARVSYIGSIINELRLRLVDIGREDILKPSDALDSRKNYSKKRRFDFVDTDVYQNLDTIVSSAKMYHDVLERDGLARGTIQGDLTAVVNFVKYLMEYYPDNKIDIKTVEEIFNPNNEVNLFSILSANQMSARATLNKIIKFLTHYELFSIKAKKNIPRKKRKASYLPYRKAMPKEMVQHIISILTNRPPLIRTKWERSRADISWWEFEVYPIFPLMMLFGYFIPVRGEQVRNLCREKSFIIKEGKLDTIIINTDKNVSRSSYQEIPCVWDDLQMFVPFLKWHKEYYKNIPTVKYHDDDNSPWEDIRPLFNTPQILKPMSQSTHFTYHKKLLCQYQLEVMEEAKKNGKKDYPIIAWAKDKKEFFKSVEELNRCSNERLKDIEIMYDLHSLRVTGATRYLESGIGINLVMQLTGHVKADTLLRFYVNLTQKEKKEKLKSSIQNIYFGEPKQLLENSADLIRGEFVQAYESGKDTLKASLKQNSLFSLNRRVPADSNSSECVLGVEIAIKHHPSTWSPMIFGICPAVKCPDGREHKCSLCPYLITGKLFIDGIVLKANQSLAIFQQASLQKQEEERKGYKNQSLAESLELMLEEILGWWEIMQAIDKDISTVDEHGKNSEIIPYENGNKSAFASEVFETELTYLANAYDAKIIGVEQDRMGLKILTIKAMKLANENKDNQAFSRIANNGIDSIDYLMSYYSGKKLDSNHYIKGFMKSMNIIN